MFRIGCVLLVSLAATPLAAQDGAALYAKQCAACHDPGNTVRAPTRDVISALPVDRIVAALATGLMRVQGDALTPQERRAIAAFLSTATSGAPAVVAGPVCHATASAAAEASTANSWNAWGVTLANDRYQRQPGVTAAQVPGLRLKWAFGFDGENSAAAQPTIVGSRAFVGSASGRVYSLGLQDGCVYWTFKADGGVRGAVIAGDGAVHFGDLRAAIYSLDAATGQVRWKKKVDEHRAARISGSVVLHGGRLYVPVSSGEEGVGGQPSYECCTFRGSVIALDAATGERVWQTHMIADPPKPTVKNKVGTQLWGPSGGAIWSAPTIDTATNSLYVATGDSYSQPAAPMTDAIVALDLTTGAIKWARQMTAGDAYNMSCGTADSTNCPEHAGPDHDFGQPPILVSLGGGRRALVIGQKSGVVHGLDPDDRGRVLWSTRIGRGGTLGGIEWGSASDGALIYVPLSDLTFKDRVAPNRGGMDPAVGGGLFALRVKDGSNVWTAPAPGCGERPNCSPGQPAPVAVIPGAVFSGSLDGHMRAYSTTDGHVLWDFDTAREFDTVNGVKARGGSIDVGGPAIAGGMVLTTSGYGTWGGQRGNVLLAFSVDGK